MTKPLTLALTLFASGSVAALAALAVLTGACNVPPTGNTLDIIAPSESTDQWKPVASYLEHRCGTLECHGNPQRNWISYGCEGLRADPSNSPGCGLSPTSPVTTPTELDDTWRSLVALEPVVMSEVVTSGGQDPDLLTFVRKARGEESHKGGALIVPGDPQDVCITSWLEGSTNKTACSQALSDYQ